MSDKLGNNKYNDLVELIYYIALPSLFNIGWASVQVSHMAILPSISINKKNKDNMVRLRTGFTFISQLLCLFLSFLIFYFIKDKYLQYSILSLICIGVGLISSLIFIIFCQEVKLSKNISSYYEQAKLSVLHGSFMNYQTIIPKHQEANLENSMNQNKYGVSYWLKKPLFYQYIIIYMLVRLSINVTCSMLPYYMENILKVKKTPEGGTPIEISILYITSTLGCIINSLFLQTFLEKYIKCRWKMMITAFLFVFFGSSPIVLIDNKTLLLIFPLSFIFGIGFSLGLSNASSLINDVVGSKGSSGAFVYGAYSFTDKLACGILLFIFIEFIKDDYYSLKFIIPLLPVFCMFLCTFLVKKQKAPSSNGKGEDDNNYSILDSSKLSFLSLK